MSATAPTGLAPVLADIQRIGARIAGPPLDAKRAAHIAEMQALAAARDAHAAELEQLRAADAAAERLRQAAFAERDRIAEAAARLDMEAAELAAQETARAAVLAGFDAEIERITAEVAAGKPIAEAVHPLLDKLNQKET